MAIIEKTVNGKTLHKVSSTKDPTKSMGKLETFARRMCSHDYVERVDLHTLDAAVYIDPNKCNDTATFREGDFDFEIEKSGSLERAPYALLFSINTND